MAGAGAEAATAAVVAASTEEVLAAVASTGAAFAVAVSMEVLVSVGDVSAVALSMAVDFVMAVLVGVITDSLMMSSSAASAFRAGGAGTIRMDITVTAITRTVTMDTVDTRTAMDTVGMVTTAAPVMDIATEAEWVMDTAKTVEPVTGTTMVADQGTFGVRIAGDKPGDGGLNVAGKCHRDWPRTIARLKNAASLASGLIVAFCPIPLARI
jgi:hypothetical protein